MSIGPWQIIIIAVLLLVLFGGRGKISNVMGDLAKGIKSFKTNIKEDDETGQIETNRSTNCRASRCTGCCCHAGCRRGIRRSARGRRSGQGLALADGSWGLRRAPYRPWCRRTRIG